MAKKLTKEDMIPVNTTVPSYSAMASWTVDDLERMLQDKMTAYSTQDKDQARQMYRVFGGKNLGDAGGGINVQNFRDTLIRQFGMPVSPEQAGGMFARIDEDSSGDVTFYEFLRKVLPDDYDNTNVRRAAHRHRGTGLATKTPPKVDRILEWTPKDYPKVWKKWTLAQIKTKIQDKLYQYATRDVDLCRQALTLFGIKAGKGIDAPAFQRVLLEKLGLPISMKETSDLFNQLDIDGSGQLSMVEFMKGIMPSDYPAISKQPLRRRKKMDAIDFKIKKMKAMMPSQAPGKTRNLSKHTAAAAAASARRRHHRERRPPSAASYTSYAEQTGALGPGWKKSQRHGGGGARRSHSRQGSRPASRSGGRDRPRSRSSSRGGRRSRSLQQAGKLRMYNNITPLEALK